MPKKKERKWSIVEFYYLIKNYTVLPLSQLSDDLLHSEEDIIRQINLLKLKPQKKGPNANPRIIKICDNPICNAAFVTTEYQMSRSDGSYCCDKCSRQVKKIRKPTCKQLKIDYEAGMSTNDIAEKYNISKGTVYGLFKKFKIKTRTLGESLEEFFKTEKGFSAIKRRLKTMQSKYGTTCLGGGQAGRGKLKSGYKEDIGVAVRSGWEGNVLRWMTFLKKRWDYEPRVFYFEQIKRGTVAYTPDIYLPDEDIWVEVKGYLRPQDKTKLRRFKKYYPEEFSKVRTVPGSARTDAAKFFKEMGIPVYAYYNDLNKKYKDVIPNWE